MKYLLSEKDMYDCIRDVESILLNSAKEKFSRNSYKKLPNNSGIYMLFEDSKNIIYIGETGNLRERFKEIHRTVNHTFRRQLGAIKFGVIKTRKKFDEDIEQKLDIFFNENLYFSYVEVNFGRLEIETYLIYKYQDCIYNSKKKRKIIITTI